MNELRSILPPSLNQVCYLNYAASGCISIPAVEAYRKGIEEAQEPFLFHAKEWLAKLSSSRATVAEMIGASEEEIAFTNNTSHGLSHVANGIRWCERDRILFPADEFPSNRIVWENLGEKGVQAEGIKPVPGVPFSEQLASHDLKNVRLVSYSAISYLDGRRIDMENVAKICRAKNILVCVDAMQAVGAIPVDVRKIDCDFLACGGRKWLFGPVGTGFLYIKKSRLDELFLSQIGLGSAENPKLEFAPFVPASGARRFESGLPEIVSVAALAASIEAMKKIGWGRIFKRIADLTQRARNRLLDFSITPPDHGGILTLNLPNSKEIHKKLFDEKIITTERNNCLRISFHASVLDEEYEKFFKVLNLG